MEHFQKIKLLNINKCSEIYLVKDTFSNELFVLKMLILVNCNTTEEKEHIKTEMKILNQLSHPNIIKLYQIYKCPLQNYLILEYGNGGTLDENLLEYKRNNSKPFPEDLVQIFMKQILCGVNYFHANGIIHRDLKLKNIVLKYENILDLQYKNLYKATVKIIDFDLCYITNINKPNSVVGTVPNMAPSIVYNINNKYPKYYDEKVDIWSLGTLCYEMLFGKPLFTNLSNKEIFDKISSADFKISHSVSKEARNFLECMLQKDGDKRLSAYQLLNHKFITGDCNKFTKYVKVFANNPKDIHRCKTSINNFYENKYSIIKTGIHIKNICQKCKKIINDYIYKCKICDNLIYCKKCYDKFCMIHNHPFETIIEKYMYLSNKKAISTKNISKYYNIIFKRGDQDYVNIYFDGNDTINNLLNHYFEKINRNDLKDNFINKIIFYYNSKNLIDSLYKKICETLENNNQLILVYETGY